MIWLELGANALHVSQSSDDTTIARPPCVGSGIVALSVMYLSMLYIVLLFIRAPFMYC